MKFSIYGTRVDDSSNQSIVSVVLDPKLINVTIADVSNIWYKETS